MGANDLLGRLGRLATKRGWPFDQRPGTRHTKVRLNGKRTVIPRHGGDLPPGTFHKIKKDLGLTDADLQV